MPVKMVQSKKIKLLNRNLRCKSGQWHKELVSEKLRRNAEEKSKNKTSKEKTK